MDSSCLLLLSLKVNPFFSPLNPLKACSYSHPLRVSSYYSRRRFYSPVTVNAAKKTSQNISSEFDDRINGSLSPDSDSRFLDRQKALEAAMNDINGSFGKGSVTRLGSAGGALVETFPSGVLTLDLALGGGLPKGRVVEIYGPESSGKTTLALHAIAEVQKLGGNAMLVDAEHAFDPSYSKALGVDVENLIVCQPDNGEMALEIADRMCRSGAVDLICVDSVSALTPRAEIEGEIGMQQMGLQARLMSQALRKMSGNASKAGCTLIFLNQIRYKIGVYYGNPEVTSGGIALKFFASVRLEIRSAGKIKSSKGDEDIGLRARVRVQKSKVSRPYKQAEFEIMFGEGVSKLGCVLDCAEIMEVVVKKGSWYSYEDQRLGQGREKALQHLRENPSLQDEIEKRVRLLMLDGEVHRSTPLFSSSSSSSVSRDEEEEDALDEFQ
ncbi:DNA repair protein recA homolog 1, chloroplastic [Brassica napus]|uniref:DNA repair protein recA homolog 1, chloroplastic n=1 Tax=Brassica napus TaxID=3708 RepID=UPI0006AAB36B|nr:DNA repair protein recA homolog 1, chloroplastic [Brassica napus]